MKSALAPGTGPALLAIGFVLALTGCYVLPDNPPVEPRVSRPASTEAWVVPADNDMGELDDPWRRAAFRRISACDMLSQHDANGILQAAFEPASPDSVLGRNSCVLREPLTGSHTRSELWLFVWSPIEGSVFEAQWEANLDGRLEKDIDGTHLQAAYFDSGTSDAPGSIMVDGGLVAITGFANLQFKSHGIWMTLQANGEIVIVPDLADRLLKLADVVDDTLEQLARR